MDIPKINSEQIKTILRLHSYVPIFFNLHDIVFQNYPTIKKINMLSRFEHTKVCTNFFCFFTGKRNVLIYREINYIQS